jgi:hypothetical protein
MVAMSIADYRSSDNVLVADSSSDAWDGLLILGGYLLIRQLPTLLDWVLNLTSQFTNNGYAIQMKKGDFELRVGNSQSMWEPDDKTDSRAALARQSVRDGVCGTA